MHGTIGMTGNRGRLRAAIKMEAIVRRFMWRSMSGRLPLYLVGEYPKSGGTWFATMLADYLDVPCPRNRVPPLSRCVMHGHHLWRASYRNAFCVLRDGRDVMVSSYFHHVVGNDRVHESVVARHRRELAIRDASDVRRHLPAYIEYVFTRHDRARFRFTWSEFVRSWLPSGAGVVRYEGLLRDPVAEMANVIEEVLGDHADRERLAEIAERHSFRSITRRRPGDESPGNFLRKGVAGDWKEKFTSETRTVFDHYAGEELVIAGYEPDRSWARRTA